MMFEFGDMYSRVPWLKKKENAQGSCVALSNFVLAESVGVVEPGGLRSRTTKRKNKGQWIRGRRTRGIFAARNPRFRVFSSSYRVGASLYFDISLWGLDFLQPDKGRQAYQQTRGNRVKV